MNKLIWLVCLLVVPITAAAQEKPKVEFRDGDRIALVGNEFFERDQDQAYIETQLTTRFPDKNLTFRNLGYSGDTVWADARSLCAGWANFGPADQGFKRLTRLVHEINPTLIFVAYGMNESFDGPKGIPHFEQGLNRMLDMLAGTGARLVLVSPIRHENLGPPLPDPAAHNRNIQLYCAAIKKIAAERHAAYVDLFNALKEGRGSAPLTSDGIHLTARGYRAAAAAFEGAMGYSPRDWNVAIDAGSPVARGTTVSNIQRSATQLTFEAIDAMLPLAPPPEGDVTGSSLPGARRTLRVSGLQPGMYELKSDGRPLIRASADELARGVHLRTGPAYEQEEQLRKLVITKNFDFFNYWRPENDTYIFGYRKHEQGRNAVEIPKFEAMVPASEAKIAKLRVPVSHTYSLTLVNGK
ncbi:MAG TPA: SGNH/GDSL hydrolase family protein [Tepidisphaeraceae bacterium]|nr:SGNH/GDSL hydrolase family protein [Tepidisphaeraceae bacterium]